MIPLSQLDARDRFVAACGPLFEHSPWVAERAWDAIRRPPSPGTPGEGRGEGLRPSTAVGQLEDPHPNPLPGYREREAFPTRDALHAALCDAMYAATVEEQTDLIASHPDLVGRLAKEGRLTRESTGEQAAAGLASLTADEAAAFDRYNAAYRTRFGFPFVICARENKKAAILAAFPVRLANDRPTEIAAALAEIAKIAKLRLFDAVSEE